MGCKIALYLFKLNTGIRWNQSKSSVCVFTNGKNG